MSDLLPTPGMGGYELEEFLGDLLKRMARIPGADPRLVSSSRNGTSGQTQGGVDHRGTYSDGTRGAWSCKDEKALTNGLIDKIIKEMNQAGETAEKRIVVYSRIANPAARTKIDKLPAWEIWDQVDLGDHVRSLLVQDARALLDTHFDETVRRKFLVDPGTDAFVFLDAYFAPLLDPNDRFHHRAALVGRDAEVAAIVAALRDPAGPRVMFIEGPAGRGKSRLALAALSQLWDELDTMPVLVRADGCALDRNALGELPVAPSIVFVEDIHRDPAGLEGLLRYARNTDGARVVLTGRPTARVLCERALVVAKFGLPDLAIHEVTPLTAAAARQLVAALQDEVQLTPPFAEGLAQAARVTPLLAVLAVELIRRNELTTPLALNADLRHEVMTRYGEAVTDGVPGATGPQVRKILATISALAQVRIGDLPLLDALAGFVGIGRGELLQLIETLAAHGVLLNRDGRVGVVPDLLGDHLLAEQTVVMGQDSGFAGLLWQAFPDQQLKLLASLANLDWRLEHTEPGTAPAPDLFSASWTDFRSRFLTADHAVRWEALDALPAVAATQGASVLPLLRDAIASPASDIPGDWLTHADVRRRCARLAGICARADSALLADVFDLLWQLAQTDAGPPHQDPDHPVRVIEQLAELGAAESVATADVLLDRVAVWLAEPADTARCRSPLSVVEPLLAKSGTTKHWRPSALEFRPYTVDPGAVRVLRDRIRQLLAPIMVGADTAAAVEAARLLGIALSEPVAYFGQTMPPETILTWVDDDLQTLAVLSTVAADTTEPLVRCHIRTAVTWTAEHATSTAVRQRSRALLTAIEAHDEDELTDLLVIADYDSSTVADLPPDSRTDGKPPTDGQNAADNYPQTVARREQERQHLAARLWQNVADAGALAARLAERLTVIAATQAEPAAGLDQTLRAILGARQDQRRALFEAIVAAPPSPLDAAVAVVLDTLLDDRTEFLQALQIAVTSRPTIVTGALRGFFRSGWGAVATDASTVIIEATKHADPAIQHTAVQSTGALLRADPLGTVPLLLTFIPTAPDAVASAVSVAEGADPQTWVAGMSDEQRRALLDLLRELPKLHTRNRRTLTALADSLPDDVLDVIAVHDKRGGSQLLQPGWGIERPFANHPAALVTWIQRGTQAAGTQRFRRSKIWRVIAGVRPTAGAASAITTIAANGTADELLFLAESLAHCTNFVLDEPGLFDELVQALDRHADIDHDQICGELLASGMPDASWRPGRPAHETIDNRDRAQTLADDDTLSDKSRQLYRDLHAGLQRIIDRDLKADSTEADV
ncbi:ATP-binding protein [Virgisporangium aurantiacum]|uniref:Uncharacterized protein n=1 Tax=Virgisporangium aurantiacum TaxID=175570 RepID=A0A8J3ZN95_9ACTN|nr:ATP-binding protein [Virgisporangium aurantiacum]GIJ64656.1 hypothetical protein Vau01_121720 [Virgisporangium aurantiacum]